jgi:hypothetical protein
MSLVGGALTWPVAASAQRLMPVIGFLNGASPEGWAPFAAAFCQGLNEAGFVEGQNVVVEYRWTEGFYDRLRLEFILLLRGAAASKYAGAALLALDDVTAFAANGVNPCDEYGN